MMLLSTPYEKNEGWIISACKWRGTIYLCAFDTEEKKKEKNNRSERLLEILSWGFKFEQYLLSGIYKPIYNIHIRNSQDARWKNKNIVNYL